MSAYSDCYALCVELTNRKAMQALTDAQIRAAIQNAHRSGTFARDLKSVQISGLSTSSPIQEIELSSNCPRLRQIRAIRPEAFIDAWYEAADIRTLLDHDGFAKLDVWWQVGTTLSIRASSPSESVRVLYFDYPNLSDLNVSEDWILVNHTDLIAHRAAAAILSSVGEQEARQRVDAFAKELLVNLIAESVESLGR